LEEGTPYVILDGKIVEGDRCREKTLGRKGREIDLRYSGKKHDFGGNVLAVLRPFLGAMPALADSGYEGAGHGVHVPAKRPAGVKELDINARTRNALLCPARCLGERGF